MNSWKVEGNIDVDLTTNEPSRNVVEVGSSSKLADNFESRYPDDPNMYQFVRGDPINAVDPSGMNAWIERDSVHERICVGTTATQNCYSFGLTSDWWAICPLQNFWDHGIVYLDASLPGATISDVVTLTPAQDAKVDAILKSTLGTKASYGLLSWNEHGSNCRSFSKTWDHVIADWVKRGII